MSLYAELPVVRYFQIARDLGIALWCILWVWAAMQIYELVAKLGGVGRSLQSTSDGLDSGVDDLPSVARSLADPLNDLGDNLRSAGDAQVSVADDLALFVAVLVAAAAILPVVVPYIARRVLWMRRFGAVSTLRHSPHFARLLAQRAMLNQPLHKLAKVSNDPMEDIAQGRFDALASLELKGLGIRK